jgi:hypothetical protein
MMNSRESRRTDMLLYQKVISRSDLRANPQVFYVFGDNAEREGLGGQAKECRGETNSIGIATKRSAKEFFSDDSEEDLRAIQQDLARLENLLRNVVVVFPHDGIGTGRASMSTKCPGLKRYLDTELGRLGIRNGLD